MKETNLLLRADQLFFLQTPFHLALPLVILFPMSTKPVVRYSVCIWKLPRHSPVPPLLAGTLRPMATPAPPTRAAADEGR
ncbi:hypothetical protein LZ31DRAFT_61578 [Colletotrichum somersetense]|nr:hypothetical protein LZ31DRAFT_61578 [Colletotrichum somersetense]